MQHAQIERQHRQHEQVEKNPEDEHRESYDSVVSTALSRAFHWPIRPTCPCLSTPGQGGYHARSARSGAVQARADAIGSVRQRESEFRRFGYVLLELREIYFVERVGRRVIVLQIVCFVLIGDKRGHTFEHKVEVIRA